MNTEAQTIIIGASAAGLAAAVCLKKLDAGFIILEKSSQVATAWRNHYDRLHLHTSKSNSTLPFKKYDSTVPKYPSRRQVVNYLDEYANEMNIQPVFNTEVISVRREDGHWLVKTSGITYRSTFLVVATGMNNKPVMPDWQGMNSFKGNVIHSSQFRTGKDFTGRKVLVVGFGNSACEQAICLQEHGAETALSVRSAVNVLPRDIFGFSVLAIGKLTSMFSPRIADKINAPLLRLMIGDIRKLGLKKSSYGPLEQIEKEKKIPLLDIGTLKLIRDGQLKVYGDIRSIESSTVYFENNVAANFDAIILATGYRRNLESFLPAENINEAELNRPVAKKKAFGKDGLYFCGFYLSPRGMLREIGIEAKTIARHIVENSQVRPQL